MHDGLAVCYGLPGGHHRWPGVDYLLSAEIARRQRGHSQAKATDLKSFFELHHYLISCDVRQTPENAASCRSASRFSFSKSSGWLMPRNLMR